MPHSPHNSCFLASSWEVVQYVTHNKIILCKNASPIASYSCFLVSRWEVVQYITHNKTIQLIMPLSPLHGCFLVSFLDLIVLGILACFQDCVVVAPHSSAALERADPVTFAQGSVV